MKINDRYNQLTSGKSKDIATTPVASFPVPNEKDYKRGYITRYFAQKTNDSNSPIYETSQIEFRKLQSIPLYNTTHLRWRISGPLTEEKIGAGEIVDKGVKESNKISIRLASDLIRKLNLYLPNHRQFHKI